MSFLNNQYVQFDHNMGVGQNLTAATIATGSAVVSGAVTASSISATTITATTLATSSLNLSATTNQLSFGTGDVVTLNSAAPASDVTINLPITACDLVGHNTTQTLSNKTITGTLSNTIGSKYSHADLITATNATYTLLTGYSKIYATLVGGCGGGAHSTGDG